MGPFWDHFGTILGPFGDVFATTLGRFWDHFGTIFRTISGLLGQVLDYFETNWPFGSRFAEFLIFWTQNLGIFRYFLATVFFWSLYGSLGKASAGPKALEKIGREKNA